MTDPEVPLTPGEQLLWSETIAQLPHTDVNRIIFEVEREKAATKIDYLLETNPVTVRTGHDGKFTWDERRIVGHNMRIQIARELYKDDVKHLVFVQKDIPDNKIQVEQFSWCKSFTIHTTVQCGRDKITSSNREGYEKYLTQKLTLDDMEKVHKLLEMFEYE